MESVVCGVGPTPLWPRGPEGGRDSLSSFTSRRLRQRQRQRPEEALDGPEKTAAAAAAAAPPRHDAAPSTDTRVALRHPMTHALLLATLLARVRVHRRQLFPTTSRTAALPIVHSCKVIRVTPITPPSTLVLLHDCVRILARFDRHPSCTNWTDNDRRPVDRRAARRESMETDTVPAEGLIATDLRQKIQL